MDYFRRRRSRKKKKRKNPEKKGKGKKNFSPEAMRMFLNRPRKKRKIPFSTRGEVGGVFRIFYFYVKLPKKWKTPPCTLDQGEKKKLGPSPRGEGARSMAASSLFLCACRNL